MIFLKNRKYYNKHSRNVTILKQKIFNCHIKARFYFEVLAAETILGEETG